MRRCRAPILCVLAVLAACPAVAKPKVDEAWDRARSLVQQGLRRGLRRQKKPSPQLVITGPDQLPLAEVHAAAGPLPAARGARRGWCEGAVGRIHRLYRARGYRLVRVWSRVERDGRVRIDIDEGRIQLVFVGVDDFTSFLYGVDLVPPGKVYHAPTLRKGMAELKRKRDLVNVYHRIAEASPPVRNRLGELVPQRELRIYVIRREFFGWKPSVRVASTWGIVPAVGFTTKELLLDDDRFEAELEIAIPWRQFLFQQEPEAQWVHGQLQLGYRLPAFWRGRIAPLVDGGTSVSRYVRSGQRIESYLTHRGDAFANAVLGLPWLLSLKVGGGMDYARAFELALAQPGQHLASPIDDDQDRYHFVARFELTKTFERKILRRDLRDELKLRLRVSTSGSDDVLLDGRFWWRFVFHLGQHDLLLRGRGVFMHGEVRFWDEAELAGEYLRCYFESRYWVREALQLGVDFRLAVTSWFKVGVFHDLAGFFDRTRPAAPLAAADGFGPSLHFLLFDFFALDLYYAFGFSPEGFDHNLSFRMERAF